jgi:hypothetical protein
MAKYYQDFVGLNTFVYEPNGWNVVDQTITWAESDYSSAELTNFGTQPTWISLGIFRYVKQNTMGMFEQDYNDSNLATLTMYRNYKFPLSASFVRDTYRLSQLAATASFFNSLMIYRNGPYGYPSWKQVRTSQNPLSRKQRLHNIFTYVEEPGRKYQIDINGKQYSHIDRYGPIKIFTEPVIAASHKPLELVGGVKFYNPKTSVEDMKNVLIKTSFGNETTFFANDPVNEYYETIEETDDNYEQLKDLYLNGGLENDASAIEQFNLLTYKQTVYPREELAYLNKTRSRAFFVNKFWRTERKDRTQTDLFNAVSTHIPSQSMWPLDPGSDWATRLTPNRYSTLSATKGTSHFYIGGATGSEGMAALGGFNTGDDTSYAFGGVVLDAHDTAGGEGKLMNSYSQMPRGFMGNAVNYKESAPSGANGISLLSVNFGAYTTPGQKLATAGAILTASCLYSRLHTLNRGHSVVCPTGMPIEGQTDRAFWDKTSTQSDGAAYDIDGSRWQGIPTSSLYNGQAAWDAGRQAGKEPFYDSYDDYAQNIRLKGQGYSIIPEFRISSHVETYETLGITEELKGIFELSGAMDATKESSLTNTKNSNNFYKVLSTSDFLKHFDLIKKDHQDFTQPSIVTMRCKAIKKFLPYEGFYPCQRTVQLSEQFMKSTQGSQQFAWGDAAALNVEAVSSSVQYLLQPLFAPGILFNTIKGGVACDFPVITQDHYRAPANGGDVQRQPTTECYGLWQNGKYMTDIGTFGAVGFTGSNGGGPDGTGPGLLVGGHLMNPMIARTTLMSSASNFYYSAFSKRIPFEALVEPGAHLRNLNLINQEPHPWVPGPSGGLSLKWDGTIDNLYSKMSHNFLAEVPEFFLKNQNFSTIESLESSNPQFGNAKSGSYYMMRIKMAQSRTKTNIPIHGMYFRDGQDDTTWANELYQTAEPVYPPQTVFEASSSDMVRESFTMYSRPTAFGPPTFGGGRGVYRVPLGKEGYYDLEGRALTDSLLGYNYPYTPPYYHGEAWCDLVFVANESRKYSVSEIVNSASLWPYETRFWHSFENDAIRDLSGGGSFLNPNSDQKKHPGFKRAKYTEYIDSPWAALITSSVTFDQMVYRSYDDSDVPDNVAGLNSGSIGTPGCEWAFLKEIAPTFIDEQDPHYSTWDAPASGGLAHPFWLNYNAMQLNSSVNLYGKGYKRLKNLATDGSSTQVEVFDSATVEAKTQWIIQPKFETPMFNFQKYQNLDENNCTKPNCVSQSVPRGIWHQYGEFPKVDEGVFLSVTDVPDSWLRGALYLSKPNIQKVKSLADLCGFKKDPIKLGQVGEVKQISEAVVAVPFIDKSNTREFFSIPRSDIDNVIEALRREVSPGEYVAGGPPKVGDSVVQMVKKMQRYVFPPSMDFVRYNQVNPFAMYIFEFTHNLTKQDLGDIWQNLPPSIGESFAEAEATISHQLLADELMGGGTVKSPDGQVNPNALGLELPTNIQWMVFKVKKRAATNYFDKVVSKSGQAQKSALQAAGERQEDKDRRNEGEDPEITYNWPYDFFSLVELVKLDAEVTFSEFELEENTQVFKPKKRIPRAKMREKKRVFKQKRKALGKSGASVKEDPSLLDKAKDWIGDTLDDFKENREKRQKKRQDRRKGRKDKREENSKNRKQKRKNKKKNKKKRKNKKK